MTDDPLRRRRPTHAELEMELGALHTQVSELRRDVGELRCDIAGLVEAWRTANGVVKFVKWLAIVVGSVTTILVGWDAFVDHIRKGPSGG